MSATMKSAVADSTQTHPWFFMGRNCTCLAVPAYLATSEKRPGWSQERMQAVEDKGLEHWAHTERGNACNRLIGRI